METKFAIAAALVIMAAASLGIAQNAIATKGTPYRAGYDHGCSDAQLPSLQDISINQTKIHNFIHKNL
jgi:hypothetical protein